MILAVTRSHQEPGNQGVIAHATDDSFAVVVYGVRLSVQRERVLREGLVGFCTAGLELSVDQSMADQPR